MKCFSAVSACLQRVSVAVLLVGEAVLLVNATETLEKVRKDQQIRFVPTPSAESFETEFAAFVALADFAVCLSLNQVDSPLMTVLRRVHLLPSNYFV